MPILVISLFLAALFLFLSFLIWLLLYLFRVRKHGRKVIKYTGVLYLVSLPLVIFCLLPLLVSHLISHASTRPKDLADPSTPAKFGREYRSITFPSRDGLALSGWLLPGNQEKPPLIFAHGLFRNRLEMLERACRFNALGYPAVLLDFRNHGQSDRRVISLGYQERQDVMGAVDYCRHGLQQGRVALIGVSMGAVASLLAARELGDAVRAVVAESPFESLDETVRRHTRLLMRLPGFPFADIFEWNLARLGRFNGTDLNILNAVAELPNTPVLFLFGRKDERMPASVGRHLYGAASSDCKHLVFFETAGHGAAFSTDPELYQTCVLEFLASTH